GQSRGGRDHTENGASGKGSTRRDSQRPFQRHDRRNQAVWTERIAVVSKAQSESIRSEQVYYSWTSLRTLCLCGEEGFGCLTAEARRAQRRASRTNSQRTLCLGGEYAFTGHPEFESQAKI